jgi:hypothetical protein
MYSGSITLLKVWCNLEKNENIEVEKGLEFERNGKAAIPWATFSTYA